MVASSHVLPLLRVSFTSPLPVPTQMVPMATVDGEMDSMALPGGAAPPPVDGASGVSLRTVRSGLIAIQWAPLSVVAMSCWNPAMSMCLFHGANTMGCDDVVRSFASGSAAGLTLIHCSLGYVIFRIPDPLE